ncbi:MULTISPECIES: class I SAM-dependent methyltransferase [unclassified Bradyrhizobium]|uniref:class I SAM-dependent methyltransferase n=1 Tax=unclassified Bradyrhizobium TaxID=2631580 RepID=UPI001BAAA4A0|nr:MULTISPECIES: class I SAM-dependent methyltransferase [unclassified Bradyrhizobium]MBR1206310.1 class I SAM-dependent methyltransferase [Bradyrhizobium sp. AUGA SZCCT0124]MBR1314974.1 class I SAM-dependent methyltransferase [Bradyrhizobium sp. AUGA SZCCT0051]MBR1341945.1 class I SAM-dependent methyltransferase [Bradyrhizobium sp. AUGA SZCCT0105]MBR1358653.1 class I SAM-dependent methyltransferase [Bradyrhizobium sp. AUGA SZCCT0045]
MSIASQGEDEQAKLWNGAAGRAWVETRDVLEGMFKPLEELLVRAVADAGASHVLDIGCGTGATTFAVAHVLGPQGHCTGIDISEPMIAVARDRAEREGWPADFICADAQTHGFAPASFDIIISRLGVMFFADPVQAFANLRRAARPGAALRFIAWRAAAENPFMTTAERAARPLLPDLPARRPDAPGQFGFADRNRVARILEDSGWGAIAIEPVDVALRFPASELIRYVSWLGPVGTMLRGMEEPRRAQVIETVRGAFDRYVHGNEIRFTAACWMVAARAPVEAAHG